jgi:hypothetical protein
MTKTVCRKARWCKSYRGTYNGVAADFIVKSSSLSGLQITGSAYPLTAVLQGKASIRIIRARVGVQLYHASGATFTATMVDSGKIHGIGSDCFALTVYDKNGVLLKSLPASLLSGENVVIHLK